MIGNLMYILYKFVGIYSGALMIYALLSWFPGGYQSVIGQFLGKICEPYIKIFDRLNLRFGGIDFTILAAIIALNFAMRILSQLVFRLMVF